MRISLRDSPSMSWARVPSSNAVKPAASSAQIVAMVRSVMRGVCRGAGSIQAQNANSRPILAHGGGRLGHQLWKDLISLAGGDVRNRTNPGTLAHEFHNRPSTHASPYRAVIGYGDRIAIAAGSFYVVEG